MNGVIFETGTVSDIDEKNVRVRVRLPGKNNLRTWWLDVLQRNTQNNKDYWLPDIGEQVRVLLDGRAEDGVVLGSTYNGADKPAIADRNRRRTDFADGTFVEYDRKNNAMAIGGAIKTLTITTHSDITLQTDTQVTVIAQNRATVKTRDALIDAANSATIKTQKATVDSPETEVTGDATIKGDLLVKGSITGQSGMAISGGKGGAAATITGSLSTTGDVSAGGTSLKSHEHPKGHNGAPTGPPSS
ncbi:phage baseplate assembly protein V [Salmonella enterica]|nr:phage baseplate assembly protein V [Salmonella enterica]ELB8084895.1 phage baseplate assembly protein V [Salmonella enterica]ELJ1892608.1 phage baseplate assembly protein V [Salmonella enterica]